MVTRRVKTGGAYVGSGGLGSPSPPQWQNTYEDQEFTGSYVADPGGGPAQWQYRNSLVTYTPVPYYTGANEILAAGLHSNAATADGLADGDTQSTSPDFTASGMDATTAKAARWTISGGNQTLLTSGGRYKYRVDTAGLSMDFVPAAGKYVACGPNGYLEKNTAGALKNKFPVDSGPYKEVAFRITSDYKGTKITVEHCWDATNTWMIIDGLPVGRPHLVQPPITSNFATMYAGGLTTATPYWLGTGYRIDNVTLNTTPFTYTTHPDISSTLFLGDSFTVQGAPDVLSYGASGILAPWHPGYGFESDGVTPRTTGDFYGDGNYITEFFRQMSAGGFLVTNTYAANQAISGAKTGAVLTRVNSLGSVPKLVICGVGTNDCADLAVTESTVRSNLRGIVDALITKGATRIIFWTCPTLRNYAPYQSTAYDNQTDMVNSVIRELPAYNPACVVVELFGPFGSHTPDTSLFGANFHPSAKGSTYIGQLMGQAAVASLTGA